MSQSFLTCKDLSCSRGGRSLFDGLNLKLVAGECMAVHGPNGSGKSTLLRVVAGLFPDYGGRVRASPSFYLGHKSAVSGLLSPRENLRWYERIAGTASDLALRGLRLSVAEALHRVGLATCVDVPCGQLSQGQLRRVGLARALVCNDPLWLLDEPLTALDGQGRALVGELVVEHCKEGGAVLCATHQPLAVPNTKIVELGRVE